MMIFKINYTSAAVTAITLLFMACNGGQLDDVRGDSTITSTTVTDTADLQMQQNEMATVTSDTLQTDSRQFMSEIENKLSLNIHLSKAAMNQSADEAIKNLGKTVVDQQTELHNKLKDIAQTKNIQLATDLTQSMQDAMSTVTSEKGKQFDITYLDRVINDSKSTIDWLESQGPTISDEQLRQFAVTAIPIFKQHLDAAEAVKDTK